ncbi:heat shock protein HslJ [Flavobacterium sp. 28YEA47A]|uniref:META domain-containing protein n=1 Tax=Flavobacterium sp. 28YEA47A TaxID=3156276 RepID=UPI0035193ACC
MKLQFILLFLGASTLAFAQKTITMKVKENTVPCMGVAPMDCMQVKEGNAKQWSNFYSTIEGFNYQPGYEYKLKVIKTKREGNIPMDVSAYTYRLKKLVSKKQVKTIDAGYLNKKMVLSQINGKTMSNGKVYLTIDNTKNSIYGKSGCNRFNAGYQLNGNQIQINLLMGTLMACDPESMQLEQEFKTTIEKKNFEIHTEKNTVHFKDPKTKKVILTFTIPTENELWAFIDGKKWKLIQMDNVGKDYGKANLQFDVKSKKVSGNSGCNNFFGSYTATADQITFSALAGTKMACIDKDAASTETKMRNYLSEATLRFDVAEQTLNFYKGDKLVMMFAIQ